MNDKAEKVYADAFFTLCLEETPDTLKNTLGELSALDGIFREQPEDPKCAEQAENRLSDQYPCVPVTGDDPSERQNMEQG